MGALVHTNSLAACSDSQQRDDRARSRYRGVSPSMPDQHDT
jgi:hypothetical protein